MLVLVTYDVNTVDAGGKRRLRSVAKKCVAHGQRVQNSVFECVLDSAQLVGVRAQLLDVMDEKIDSIRIYNLGNRTAARIEQYGLKQSYDPEGDLIL